METERFLFIATTQLMLVGVGIFGIILGVTTAFRVSKEDRQFYYPNWLSAIGFFFVVFLEVIYVHFNFSPLSFLFANSIGLLLPFSIAFISCEKFFFFKGPNKLIILISSLAFIPIIPIIIELFLPGTFSSKVMDYIYILINILFVFYIIAFGYYLIICKKRKVERFKMEYSNIADFPNSFALQMFIAMTIWVILHAVVFYANNQYLKAWMDIVRAIIGIGMTILWMGLNREKKSQEVHEIITLNEMKMATTGFGQNSLLEKLHQVMQTELLYLNPNLRLTDLQSKLYTNRTYLSRAINEVPGQSFYSIVLNYRIEYAKKLLITEPSKKLDEIAILSGFSSRSYFSRIFKEEVGITPSKYRELIEQKVG